MLWFVLTQQQRSIAALFWGVILPEANTSASFCPPNLFAIIIIIILLLQTYSLNLTAMLLPGKSKGTASLLKWA